MIPARVLRLAAIIGVVTVVALIVYASSPSVSGTGLPNFTPQSSSTTSRGFHFLLPVTSPGAHFCRLLLSATILGYPEPIFIGWAGHGSINGTISHLFKISETLAYLNSLPPEADDDLVLELDAFDIWLQVRPEVIISRYYQIIEKADRRLAEQGLLGKDNRGADVRNTVVFGPDKLCWPFSEKEPACWAVPQSGLPPQAFGPDTDKNWDGWQHPDQDRPRWLNSGTIMGPVKEIRAIFAATMKLAERGGPSDQFHFATLWGDQELSRLLLRDGGAAGSAPSDAIMTELEAGKRTEYHLAVDSDSVAFQTVSFYSLYLIWMTHNHTSRSVPAKNQHWKRLDQFPLATDIAISTPPFAAALPEDNLPTRLSWADLKLGTNVITGQVFPVFHVTGHKGMLHTWWPRMWFFPYGEALLRAAGRQKLLGSGSKPIAEVKGISWIGAKMEQTGREIPLDKGIGWTDQGEHMEWDELCAGYQHELFEWEYFQFGVGNGYDEYMDHSYG